jgi:hypothetical protein
MCFSVYWLPGLPGEGSLQESAACWKVPVQFGDTEVLAGKFALDGGLREPQFPGDLGVVKTGRLEGGFQ